MVEAIDGCWGVGDMCGGVDVDVERAVFVGLEDRWILGEAGGRGKEFIGGGGYGETLGDDEW